MRFFRMRLPGNWTCEKPEHDYGVDLRVEVFENQKATGIEMLIQLKASQQDNDKEYENIRLKYSTYNYLWDKMQVVMLVKYVKASNKAYWKLLSDVEPPNAGRETFLVKVLKENDLDSIDWARIEDYLTKVKYRKLSVRERNVFGVI